MEDVFQRYRDEVREHVYPGPEHTVFMQNEELEQFAKDMSWDNGLKIVEDRRSAS